MYEAYLKTTFTSDVTDCPVAAKQQMRAKLKLKISADKLNIGFAVYILDYCGTVIL